MGLTLGLYDLVELYPERYNERLLNRVCSTQDEGVLLLTIGVFNQQVLVRYPDGTTEKVRLKDIKDNINMDDPRYWESDTPAKQKQIMYDQRYKELYEKFQKKVNATQHRVVEPRQSSTYSGYQYRCDYDIMEVDRKDIDDVLIQLDKAHAALLDAKKLIQKLD